MIVLRTYSNSKRRAETKLNKTLGQMSYSPWNKRTLEEIANDTPKGKARVKAISSAIQKGGSKESSDPGIKFKEAERLGIQGGRSYSKEVPGYTGKRGAEIARRRKANLERIGTTAKLQQRKSKRILDTLRGGVPLNTVPVVPKSETSKLVQRLLKR
jgi:hypothetical protein